MQRRRAPEDRPDHVARHRVAGHVVPLLPRLVAQGDRAGGAQADEDEELARADWGGVTSSWRQRTADRSSRLLRCGPGSGWTAEGRATAVASVDENYDMWQRTYRWPDAGDEWSSGWGGPQDQWRDWLGPRLAGAMGEAAHGLVGRGGDRLRPRSVDAVPRVDLRTRDRRRSGASVRRCRQRPFRAGRLGDGRAVRRIVAAGGRGPSRWTWCSASTRWCTQMRRRWMPTSANAPGSCAVTASRSSTIRTSRACVLDRSRLLEHRSVRRILRIGGHRRTERALAGPDGRRRRGRPAGSTSRARLRRTGAADVGNPATAHRLHLDPAPRRRRVRRNRVGPSIAASSPRWTRRGDGRAGCGRHRCEARSTRTRGELGGPCAEGNR